VAAGPVERPSTQPAGSVLQQIQENAFGPPPSSNRPANTATAPPADPRLTSMTPRDPRLAAAPVAATSNHVPTDLIENQTPPAGTGSLLFNELAQMAGSSYSPALSLAHLSSAPMGFVPALSIDPRLAASSQSYSIAPSVSALVESKSKQPAAPRHVFRCGCKKIWTVLPIPSFVDRSLSPGKPPQQPAVL